MKKTTTKTAVNIAAFYQNPKYRGRYVIVVGKDIYTAKSGKSHNPLLEKLMKDHPDETPLVTYIPREDTLIFCNF